MKRWYSRFVSGSLGAFITIPVDATAQYFSEGLIDPGLMVFFALVTFLLFFFRGKTVFVPQ